MRDVEKTSMRQETNYRRARRRRRGMTAYAMLVFLAAIGVVITLSMTVLFNIKEIQVTGDASNYTAEEIVAATGISVGDNLVRLNVSEAEAQGLEQLVYAKNVTITRQFPNTLLINVQRCIPRYNVKYENGMLVVSEHGRILRDSMDPEAGLITIYGYKPFEPAPGKMIAAEEERHDTVFQAFQQIIEEKNLVYPVISIDMTNLYDIHVNFDNRIDFAMGNWNEIDYKITFAQEVISKQPAGKEGYLTMVGNNQVSFRSKDDVEQMQQNLQEVTTEAVTDAFGNPVTETTESGMPNALE